MEPSSGNRVTLSDARDVNGQPLARVRHRCTELDRRSMVELHRALREELSANGIGELEGDLERAEPWPIDQDASHHMGSTRMGLDPRTSVVDPELRVHGTANVWVAGSSVFPTSGCANPTYTIVALSIRLARHLRNVRSSCARESVA
jgi:choline dehydrogenase-like flavoprotein